MLRFLFDAIVFDFDGVLVESTDVKTHAFGALYAEHGPEIQRCVIEHHVANAGLSRYLKFRFYQEQLLGVPYSEADGVRLSNEFSSMVVDLIVKAPYVRGAHEFLLAHHRSLPLFVASGTPQDELLHIVEKRGMAQYFQKVRGTPATKGEILGDIIGTHGFSAQRVLMVGDAYADWEGAQQAGALFIGRRSGKDVSPFPPGTRIIPDLTVLQSLITADSRE